MSYKLLDTFEGLFTGREFHHRSSNQGDSVAVQLYEDLYALGRSQKFVARVDQGIAVANLANTRQGVAARRGDGSFGEILPNEPALAEPGHAVHRGRIATIEIGVEVKIIQKAMIRQIGRVISDLEKQVSQFKLKGGSPITVGIVGINRAPFYVSYEGATPWLTTGVGRYKHPFQEADETERRLLAEAAPKYDEFIVLPFSATNDPPYAFAWIDPLRTQRDYGASLVRISSRY